MWSQANMHLHMRNAVMLVWGSLRLTPIIKKQETETQMKGNFSGFLALRSFIIKFYVGNRVLPSINFKWQINRQTDRQTSRQTDGETDRQQTDSIWEGKCIDVHVGPTYLTSHGLPFVSPTANRNSTAIAKLTLKPKAAEKRPRSKQLVMMTGFLPFLSATAPHT